MKPFAYERAGSVRAAVTAAVDDPGAVFLGGGTNLVDHLRLGITHPGRLIDVSRLPLEDVEELPDGGLRIGATLRNSDLAAHPLVRTRFPVLSRALLAGASGQLRNAATTAGNLLQRTRCRYFQDPTTPCNKRDPGSGCSALTGYTRQHAVFGASEECIAVHPSDMAVAAAALDAVVVTTGPEGERRIPVTELLRLPGDEPQRDNTLLHGELITALEVPPLPAGARSGYRKVRDRASFAFALVSVAAVVETEGGTVRWARIALGGVAHKPWRATRAEDALAGAPATEESFRRAAEAELAAAEPLSGNAFKVPMARRTLTAVLSDLTAEEPQ
ncbi:FAD binding domain-containing protein [Streptomyces xiaopingdaonensis]|uniref:FAD binding domain-containing protein n=1 Tax=Streptomyces xiaopingdaonensis TaxID=1565415 RepID=UPI0003106D39|nr:xanthine dehydrogenase family protein subunit M [Streptomyces xiaopingdaonensis]